MYEFIKGTLVEISPIKIIIETNNIGYKILIPISSYSNLPHLNSEIMCYTSLVIKEDSHTIYGFLSKKERDLFEILITISGIGPKTALALIGHLDISLFSNAIKNANTRLISKVPGIGKKTAERLIIEIRDKIKIFEKDLSEDTYSQEDTLISDAIGALINLGYNHLQAQKVIKKTLEENKDEKDVGKLIGIALKKI